jgi:josephin
MKKNYEAIWFDKRKVIDKSIIDNRSLGFILNVPSDYKIGFVTLPLRRRHWIAIKQIDSKYWNLDSKLDQPLCIGDEADLLCYLRSQLQSNDKELFIVVQKDIEKEQGHTLNNNQGNS